MTFTSRGFKMKVVAVGVSSPWTAREVLDAATSGAATTFTSRRRRVMPVKLHSRENPGRYTNKAGYVLLFWAENGTPFEVLEHRIVWERYNGAIPAGMVIHHINRRRSDNRIENLAIMTPGEHSILHNTRLFTYAEKKEAQDKVNSEYRARVRSDPEKLAELRRKQREFDMRRRPSRGMDRGECHPCAKFTNDQVADMRLRWSAGDTVRNIANTYNSKYITIYQIVKRITWKHLD